MVDPSGEATILGTGFQKTPLSGRNPEDHRSEQRKSKLSCRQIHMANQGRRVDAPSAEVADDSTRQSKFRFYRDISRLVTNVNFNPILMNSINRHAQPAATG